MAVEFTDQERERLGGIFSAGLFTKVTTVIRDHILNGPKFTEKVDEVVAQNSVSRQEFGTLASNVAAIEEVVIRLSQTEPPAQPAPQETAEEVKVKKPEETPTEMINRLIKEVLGGQYGIPHNLWSYLEGLSNEDEIRRNLEKYNQVRRELIYIDRELNRRYDYRKIKYLAGQVTLGLTTIEQAKTEYRGSIAKEASNADGIGDVEDAKTGLAAGLKGA